MVDSLLTHTGSILVNAQQTDNPNGHALLSSSLYTSQFSQFQGLIERHLDALDTMRSYRASITD